VQISAQGNNFFPFEHFSSTQAVPAARSAVGTAEVSGGCKPSAGVICCAICFSHLNMGSFSGDINNRIDRGCPGTRVISPFFSSFRIIW